jgi:hypothetical protein
LDIVIAFDGASSELSMNMILNVTARRDRLVVHWLMTTAEELWRSKSSAEMGSNVPHCSTGAVKRIVALLSVETSS